MAVLHVLDTVGGRLLRRAGRSVRHHSNRLREVDRHRRHTVIPAQADALDELMRDTLRFFDATAPAITDDTTASCVRQAITTYLRDLITDGREHDRSNLQRMIVGAGCLQAAA